MRGERIPPWRRRNSAIPKRPIQLFLDGGFATPQDTSEPGCWRRYSCFVLLTAFVTSAVLLAPLMLHLERQRQRSRTSLLRDLQRSRDHGVHPCDDFYRHVCSGWDGNLNRRYRTPLATYSSVFDERVIKSVLRRRFPSRSAKAQDKASAFLLTCLSRTGRRNTWSLSKVLLELGLPWPRKSSATRYDLLNTLVKASLHFGTSLFWAFYVGRHPSRPHEHTIYMTLEMRCFEWIADFGRLMVRERHDDYLRRCAEIVGGIGQSYSTMIHAVTTMHLDIAEKVRRYWYQSAVPYLQRMDDFELRRAVNGYLPDDSQLWPDDDIVNMQPELFHELNQTQFTENAESFRLYLGAYAVWRLSPFASHYLTAALLGNMGWAGALKSHRLAKCLEALESIMPLVMWKLHDDTQGDRTIGWTMQQLTAKSVSKLQRVTGHAFGRTFNTATRRVSNNAYNMTLTWGVLDQAYAHVRPRSYSGLFDMYLQACRLSVNVSKQSMRRPRNIMLHAPGIAGVILYRNLVAREVVVESFRLAAAPADSPHLLPVLAAFVGTEICKQLLTIARFLLRYDGSFRRVPAPNNREDYDAPLEYYEKLVRGPRFADRFTRGELREVIGNSLAAYFASYIPSLPEAHAIAAERAGAHASDEQSSLIGVSADQLFFLVNCFTHCGEAGTAYELRKINCNLALPSIGAFRRAFKCEAQHRLVTNFTWPEPVNVHRAVAA
ncbi:uncharacterized protein [Dermacentor andersoni]|uniref:uncharacterized protein n=1 Tax=Dermacentor andersoni TaxID=34620 RepID=UPI002415D54D|nr:uncharacterized protein LOC129383914 [Dermacentor andersoni]